MREDSESPDLAEAFAPKIGPGHPGHKMEITESTGLSQPNTSNHLSCLLGCGLVTREQQGRFVHYRLSDTKLVSLLSLAEEIANGVASDLLECPHCSIG